MAISGAGHSASIATAASRADEVFGGVVKALDDKLTELAPKAEAARAEHAAAVEKVGTAAGMREGTAVLNAELGVDVLYAALVKRNPRVAQIPGVRELLARPEPVHAEAAALIGYATTRTKGPTGNFTFTDHNIPVSTDKVRHPDKGKAYVRLELGEGHYLLLESPKGEIGKFTRKERWLRPDIIKTAETRAFDSRVKHVLDGDWGGYRDAPQARGARPPVPPPLPPEIVTTFHNPTAKLDEAAKELEQTVAALRKERETAKNLLLTARQLEGAQQKAGTSDALALEGAELLKWDGLTPLLAARPIGSATELAPGGATMVDALVAARELDPEQGLVIVQTADGAHHVSALTMQGSRGKVPSITAGDIESIVTRQPNWQKHVHPDVRALIYGDKAVVIPRPDPAAAATALKAVDDLFATSAQVREALDATDNVLTDYVGKTSIPVVGQKRIFDAIEGVEAQYLALRTHPNVKTDSLRNWVHQEKAAVVTLASDLRTAIGTGKSEEPYVFTEPRNLLSKLREGIDSFDAFIVDETKKLAG